MLRIRLRRPIPLSIEPKHEPYGELLREIELDELPMDELVAQEAHAKAKLLEIPDVLCGKRTMVKSFVDYLGKVNKRLLPLLRSDGENEPVFVVESGHIV